MKDVYELVGVIVTGLRGLPLLTQSGSRRIASPVMRSIRRLAVAPMILPYFVTGDRGLIDADVARRIEILRRGERAARSPGDARVPKPVPAPAPPWSKAAYALARLLAVVYRPEPTLHLKTPEIGPGLFIQHGFATIVAAERVGANCWVNQQVTIGFDATLRAPVLEDDVTVNAGAKVIGGVTVGEGSTVGANAVVVRDVPKYTTAVGVPAHR